MELGTSENVETINLKSRSQSEALISKYRRFAENCAAHIMRRLNLPAELHSELVSAAYLGLVEASQKYNPKKKAEFKSYAYLRIRGAIIDTVRDTSELSTQAYQYLKALEVAQELKQYELHEERAHPKVEPNEIEKLAKMFNYASKGALAFRLIYEDREEEIADNYVITKNPEELLEEKRIGILLKQLIQKLPAEERKIIRDYYFHDKSFVEIAAQGEGSSKSWISRLHARALDRLHKAYLNELKHRSRASIKPKPLK